MKILICDDSLAMRRIVQRTLRQAGYDDHEVIEAENGKVGFEKTIAESPDLILSDWNMPEMTGIEFLAAVREHGLKTPFGFITTEGTPEMRKRAEDGGSDFLLSKPFTPDQMAEQVDKYLS